MHVLIAGLYATTIWLALLAYSVITGRLWIPVLAAGPIVISALIGVLIGLDALIERIGRHFHPPPEPSKPPPTL